MKTFRPEDCYLSATELAARIRARKVSPVEVIDALEDRIKTVDPKVNAYLSLDLKNARKDAEAKWKARQEHPEGDLGPLHGVPVAIKDDLPVKGLPWTNGSRLCADTKADYDDATVERLRRAGAIILGKTHLPEFGHKGTTDNRMGRDGARVVTVTPWDLKRTAGGSSGGSAAAVSAGLAFLALGSDIGGSVRIPASFCGIVGHKPSFGVIPRVPSGNAFSLWVLGPLARTVADTALAMRVLAGPDPRDRFSLPGQPDPFDLGNELPALKLLWSASPTGMPVEDGVAALAHDALKRLSATHKGIKIKTAGKPMMSAEEEASLRNALETAFGADALYWLCLTTKITTRAEFDRLADRLSPSFAEFVRPAWDLGIKDYLGAQGAITAFCEGRAAEFFGDYDLIATPTLAVPPFDRDLDLGPDRVGGKKTAPHLGWTLTWPFNLTGEPAVSVPCGWTKEGLPVGLQIVGRRGQDGLVLRVAAALEKIVGWPDRRPPL